MLRTDPAGTCSVDDTGGPRACNPTHTFEQQLRAFITDSEIYDRYLTPMSESRGYEPLYLFFDAHPEEALRYHPPADLPLVERALATWILDYHALHGDEVTSEDIMRHHDAIMQGVQEGGLFLGVCEGVATVSSALPRMLGSAGGEILGATGGLSGKGGGASRINEASETAGEASGIEGATKTAGGQEYSKSCNECAKEIAKQRGLPDDFSAKTGTFNPMYEKYKGQGPTHVAVRNPDGTITDTTILQNIFGYSDHQVPSDLQKYNETDTFTEQVYDQLITRFYDAWKAKQ